MFYQIFENLIEQQAFKIASEQSVEAIDSYLADLNENQAQQLSPWRVANKLGLKQNEVLEVLLKASEKGLLSTRFEVWSPVSRRTIFTTFDAKELTKPVEDADSPDGQFVPSEEDIHLSFRLNEVLNFGKKKALFPRSFELAFSH